MLQVQFKSRDPQADEMRDVALRRTRFVFRRINWLMPKATVQLSDVNGPRGGIDKRFQVEIKSDIAGTVVVASVARDWRTALDNALSRAARFLMRQWRREMTTGGCANVEFRPKSHGNSITASSLRRFGTAGTAAEVRVERHCRRSPTPSVLGEAPCEPIADSPQAAARIDASQMQALLQHMQRDFQVSPPAPAS